MVEQNEVKPEPTFIEAVERMEKANAERKEILKREEELAARNLLGGRTDAGLQPDVKKEETPQEYAARVSLGKI